MYYIELSAPASASESVSLEFRLKPTRLETDWVTVCRGPDQDHLKHALKLAVV